MTPEWGPSPGVLLYRWPLWATPTQSDPICNSRNQNLVIPLWQLAISPSPVWWATATTPRAARLECTPETAPRRSPADCWRALPRQLPGSIRPFSSDPLKRFGANLVIFCPVGQLAIIPCPVWQLPGSTMPFLLSSSLRDGANPVSPHLACSQPKILIPPLECPIPLMAQL